MKESVYSRKLKSSNTKTGVAIVIFIMLGLTLLGYVLYPIWGSSFNRIEITSGKQLAALGEGSWVSITTKEFYYTGYTDTENDKDVAFYYALDLNDVIVIARSKKDYRDDKDNKEERTFTGILTYDHFHSDNIAVLVKMGLTQEDATSLLLPLYVSDKKETPIWALLSLEIVIIAFLAGQISIIKRNKKAKQRLESYGNLEQFERYFDQEFANKERVVKYGQTFLTPKWIFSTATTNTFIMPLSELVWVYQTTVSHRTNGIPSGKSYKINLYFSDGSGEVYPMFKKSLEQMIEEIRQRSPQTFIGYSDELASAWKSNYKAVIDAWRQGPDDRSEPSVETEATSPEETTE